MTPFQEKLTKRRSYRQFENAKIDIQRMIDALTAAKHAPSGANKQPWTFCLIQDPLVKQQIRQASETVEARFYQKITKTWADDLATLKTAVTKPFLEEAPYLIVIFKHLYQLDKNGEKTKVYYPDISVGIATGMLISSLTDDDIDTLTYTPSDMRFLKDILKRPSHEKPYMILVCGKGDRGYQLPEIKKKANDEVIKIY